MEPSHGDQTESSAAAGFPPAHTPPPPHPGIPLSHRSTFSLRCSLGPKTTPLFPGLHTGRLLSTRNVNSCCIVPLPLAAFCVSSCNLCSPRAGREQSLTSLCLKGVFTQPCTQGHHSALTPGRSLAPSHQACRTLPVLEVPQSSNSLGDGRGQTTQGELNNKTDKRRAEGCENEKRYFSSVVLFL